MAKTQTMRGLQNFISDIRSCQNKEAESKRVDKELAKIRARFGEDKPLSAYDRRKYVWKLLYIYMLGYDVEFGHKQACDLIPAGKYSEKQVGYMACSILLNETDEFLRLAINGIHNDLISGNEAFQCLGLTFVANVGGQEMAEALTNDVLKLLTKGASRPIVKKKAALCLLRLIRKMPADAQLVQSETFAPVIKELLDDRDIGLLLSSITLLLGICSRIGTAGYELCQAPLLKVLERLVLSKDIPPDYTYYNIASPWAQCKTLRALQYFPPPESPGAQKALHDILAKMIANCAEGAKSTNVNKSNAQHAILFEAIALCLHYDTSKDLLTSSVSALGKFLTVKEPNIKYLALENMSRLALVPEILAAIRQHQSTIIGSLKDPDVSIRKRAMDLLFTMCDAGNADDIVQELVKYLTVADFTMREELVLKIAILAEKFAPSVQWYVDITLQLLERAGDFCSADIWHRVVQLVTNNEDMQQYAAHNVAEVLRGGAAHESLICTAAYVLGEFGHTIREVTPPLEQFRLLNDRFLAASAPTKGLLLTAYMKLALLDPADATLAAEVGKVFTKYGRFMDAELQQRAVEYKVIVSRPAEASAKYVLPMPKWEERESTLLRRLQQAEGAEDAGGATADRAAGLLSAVPAGLEESGGSGALGSPRIAAVTQSPKQSPNAAAAAAAAAAAPFAPTAATAAAPVIDLLGGDDMAPYSNGTSAAAAAPYAAAAPASVPGDLGDLLGSSIPQPSPPSLGAMGSGTASDPFATAGFAAAALPTLPAQAFPPAHDIQPTGDVNAWYTALLTKDRGLLYQDPYLQIGVQSRYLRGRGEILLFLGNQNASQPLEQLALVLGQNTTLQAVLGDVPSQLAPSQQVKIPLTVSCVQPLSGPVTLQLGYTVGGRAVLRELRLPVVPHKFMVPEPGIAREVFFESWKQIAGPPCKQQEMVQRATPLSVESAVAILRTLGFGVEHGYLDPSPHNEAGAATFVFGAPEQALLVQCRVEGNPQNRMQFRVTVASPSPTLAAALKEAIVEQITLAA